MSILSRLEKKKTFFIDDESLEINNNIFWFKICTKQFFNEKYPEIYDAVLEGLTINFVEDKVLIVVRIDTNFKLDSKKMNDPDCISNKDELLMLLNVESLDEIFEFDFGKYGLVDHNTENIKIVKVKAFNKRFKFNNFIKLRDNPKYEVTFKLYSHFLLDFLGKKKEYVKNYKVSKCAIYIKLINIDAYSDVELFLEELSEYGLDVITKDYVLSELFNEANIFTETLESRSNLKISEKAIRKLIK